MTISKSKLDNLSPEEKKKLLAKLLQNKTKLFPTSFAQQRLWFLQQLEPENTAYNLPAALLLVGQLNINILTESINEVIQRHEILRTAFVAVEDKPQQKIITNIKLNLPVTDLRLGDRDRQDAEIKNIIDRQINKPFNLAQAPLLRTQLLQLDTNKYLLVFILHHIITDYYSMRVLIKELAHIYHAKLNNISSPLPALELQYLDFAVWQCKWLNSDNLKTQLNYWKKQLADAPSLLNLPTDYPRPPRQTFNGATHTFKLSSELSQSLQKLSQRFNNTLFMTLMAGFKALLYRYTQQSDILVGSTVANRDKAEINNLIGLFVNNLIFRTKFNSNITFKQLLEQVRETILSAYEHQDLPYEYLVEKLQPERNLSHNPLFQVMFILHNTAADKVELPDLNVNYLPIDNHTARFDLSLDMYETESGLIGSFEYNTDLFKPETIARLVIHFTNLLTQVTANCEVILTKIDYLSSEEKQQLLGDRNIVNYPQDYLVHELFEIKCAEGPGKKTALITEEQYFTYAELNERANQLANYLHRKLHKRALDLNCGSDSPIAPTVGIFLPRNSDLIISLLAVLKTGAAYIPLDPDYPAERINYIIQDAKISFLIANNDLELDDLAPNLSVINLDRERENIAQQSSKNLSRNIQTQDLAYVIYTSGSTGKPKGVAIQHNSLLNLLYSMQQQLGIEKKDTLLAVTTISFDIAALEIFLPLITGATLVLATRDTAIDADRLSQEIENQITIMQATPATWRMLLDNNWQGNPDLKVLCGGEALPQTLAQELEPRCQEIWNLYGPTETTIWSSVCKYSKQNNQLVPIGKAIANTQFYVLDAQLNLVPPGIAGELYIAGTGLARGYLNRPDLTAARFIPNPFSVNSHQSALPVTQYPLLYQTGDRVRQLPSGDLEYLGRLDNQVKIRGFRIELGEIEAVLIQHPQIQMAVVIPHQENLIAYYLDQQAVAINEIRSFLQQQLPSYMIPGTVIPLESFPLTPNGKIDRQGLTLPDVLNIQQDKNTSWLPLTSTEEILLGIWTEILDRNEINLNSNFFELGGHSLLVTRVVSQIRQALAIELPLRALFEHPTIRDLALVIDSQKNKSQLSTIEVISRDGELPLSFAQQRQWFLHQLDPDNPAYNISTAVQITGNLDVKRLQQCLNILVKGQEVLQTAFLTVAGKPQVIINTDAAIALETVDLTTLPQTEKQLQVRQLQQEDSQTPFVLERSPLLRVKLLQMAADEQILLLSVHHIIADGWSMGVLVREMVELYTTSPLIEEKSQTIQYLDYAAWQRTWLQGDVLEQQLDYWQQQLQNAPVISSFPANNSRKTEPAPAGITRFKIDCQTTKKLRQISRQQQATLFMTVLSALHLLLHRYTGNDDLIIGTPIANRDRPEIESLIGLFTNTLALRANLTNNPSFTELLTQVKENTLTAYAHSDLPFEQLVDRLELSRSLSYTPLFQIFLAWETQTNQKLEVEDLTWESLPRDTATVAKFDMTFFLTETREDIHGAIEYNTALYNPETIDRLAKHFQNLLTSIVTQPSQPISEIDFLDSTEKKQLLAEFNQTKIDIPQNVCLHQLFETQVELTPNAPALVDRQQQLTYAELNVRANNLASYLKCCGVKAETKIGVMCDRNSEMTIALLAILKAGGCYIPLDPKYPPQRLDYILEDTQLNILLTQTKHQDQFPDSNLTIINLDAPTPSASPTSSAPSAHPDNLAYIIYTSGSTGKPKGVAIAHKSAVTLCYWAKNTFAPSQLAGVLAATSICFDLAIFEIFVTLAIGGAVILAENALELPSLNPTIPITLINTVPSAARELLRINGIPETVNTVNLAGEALPQDLVDKLYRQPHIKQVYNLYGPSEDTTYSTYSLTTAEDTQPLTIGKAIANTQTYILDKYLKPVPIGISGELYLAGDGLARGYFNRPNLTAAKFIPNPFLVNSHQSALPVTHYSLLYQTGDRVRQLPSGDLEYLGRLDNQIKIRGFRIELGEIETILASHPDIETAVVIKRDRTLDSRYNGGNLRNALSRHLIAYIIFNSWTRGAGVARNFTPPTSHKLRQFVAEKLPHYMIPVAFVSLDKFPLTPNGKIDKKSLPKSEFTKESEGEGLFAPTAANTKTEAKLVKIWQKLLNIDKIGINDNFFALGGDSILAIQVIAKASQLGIQLTPKNLFQNQTIAQLAAVAKSDRQTVAEQGIVTGIVPLTPIQHWFFTQELQDYHHWNQSIWLEAKPLQADLLEQAIVKLLQHHDALRLSFSRTETGWQQFDRDLNLNSPLIEYDLSALTEDERETAQLKIAARLQSSFELSTAPLIKIAWFKFGNCADQLLIIAHHLIIDGVSWRIILEDLTTIYQQLTLGQELLLAPKTTSWKQWSEELQNINLKSELAYWSEQKNRSEPVEFTISTVEGAKVIAIALSTAQTQQLLTEVSTAYQTQINDLLLTALAQTWQTIYNQNSLLIELEGHGREDIIDNVDVSRTVGWFTTISPLVLNLATTDIAKNIKSIKEQIRSVPNKGIGYGILRYLTQELELLNFPQALIKFNYLGQIDNLFTQDKFFQPLRNRTGTMRSLRDNRSCAIELESMIRDEQLTLNWIYSNANYSDIEMEQISQTYLDKLQELIKHCLKKDSESYTPSDFAQMDFSQDELDDLLDDL